MRRSKATTVAMTLVLALGFSGVHTRANAGVETANPVFIVEAADDLDIGAEALTVDLTYLVKLGWQMLSLISEALDRIGLANNDIQVLFPESISAFVFAAGYSQVNNVPACEGFWLNMAQDAEYVLRGSADDKCVTDLPQGWSMVGVPVGGVLVDDIISAPITSSGVNPNAPDVTSIFGFQGGYVQKVSGDLLEQGQGYWFNMANAAQVTMNSNTGGVTAKLLVGGLPATANLSNNSKLVISRQGIAQTVFLGLAPEDMTALPPSPPEGLLDLRVEVDGVAMNGVPHANDVREYSLQMSGSQRLEWDIDAADGRMWDLVVNGSQVHTLTGRGSLTLSEPNFLSLRYTPLPSKFALDANYPNPFNPSTTIGYDLADASQVTLTIYDVLGQEVHSLVNEWQPAGTYQVAWDGRAGSGHQVASGLYFYELRAGAFRSMHKMLLSK